MRVSVPVDAWHSGEDRVRVRVRGSGSGLGFGFGFGFGSPDAWHSGEMAGNLGVEWMTFL